MTEQSRQKTASKTGAATLEFNEFDLQTTMQDFLKEEEKETGKGIWNIATISGMVMLFLGLSFVLQWIGLPIGAGFASFVEGAVSALPLIGGALVTLIGFGYLVGDRKKERKARRQKKKAEKQRRKSNYSDIHGAEEVKNTGSGINNDLNRSSTSSFRKSSTASSSSANFDTFGYRQSRKLMKSRSDKKWAGVCGGLAKYFGISSTVVRFIFVAAFFMGYGASLLIYFGLSLAMPKEPIEFMDDFNY
ncbi:PspC domain-containing protein [Balneola sp. MJW-20]|uniref:PspC domain-containing protein n=1 Tax=Gracilimonas aurantiaca TaxID=3234185 RepID=UPI003466B47C